MIVYLMKCGHIALGQNAAGKPICPICAGSLESEEIDKVIDIDKNPTEGLEGRFAYSPDSKYDLSETKVPSAWNLPFFHYNPNKDSDEYYDGSWGWD
jgi:hypothetical protein